MWKVLGAASGIGWILLSYVLLSGHMLLMLLTIGFTWGLSVFGPDLMLSQHITKRRVEIQRRMPDTLDLLVISVEAGLGFEQALDRTATTVPGPLSEELRRMLQETRMGASRADALRALDERTNVEELRSFIVAMLQADYVRCLDRSHPAHAGRRDASSAPLPCAREVPEGTGAHAVPVGAVHLPGDVGRRGDAGLHASVPTSSRYDDAHRGPRGDGN